MDFRPTLSLVANASTPTKDVNKTSDSHTALKVWGLILILLAAGCVGFGVPYKLPGLNISGGVFGFFGAGFLICGLIGSCGKKSAPQPKVPVE